MVCSVWKTTSIRRNWYYYIISRLPQCVMYPSPNFLALMTSQTLRIAGLVVCHLRRIPNSDGDLAQESLGKQGINSMRITAFFLELENHMMRNRKALFFHGLANRDHREQRPVKYFKRYRQNRFPISRSPLPLAAMLPS